MWMTKRPERCAENQDRATTPICQHRISRSVGSCTPLRHSLFSSQWNGPLFLPLFACIVLFPLAEQYARIQPDVTESRTDTHNEAHAGAPRIGSEPFVQPVPSRQPTMMKLAMSDEPPWLMKAV